MSVLRLPEYRRLRTPGIVSNRADLARELIVNGTFASDVSGWSATAPASIAFSGGTLRVSRTNASYATDMCYQDVPVVVGEWYALKFDYVYENTSGTTLTFDFSWDGGTTDIQQFTTPSIRNGIFHLFQAVGNTLRIIFKPSDIATGVCGIDNVSIKRILYVP